MRAIILYHPQSAVLLTNDMFDDRIRPVRIACGTTKAEGADLFEANDFFPTYASWNSCLFETSVILTVWEHADQLIGDDHVVVMHSDIELHMDCVDTWTRIIDLAAEGKSVGITAPIRFRSMWAEWLVPSDAMCTPEHDPFYRHAFDNKIHVWDYIKKYDPDIYDFAMSVQPKLIYSHQFACSRGLFDILGQKLFHIASRLRLRDIGFWTPHMFERLIALYLAMYSEPVLTTAFWHFASSGVSGPGEQSLYGPRPLKFYKIMSRHNSA